MFNFCSLYSGSSGNSLLVQSDNANILIDAALLILEIEGYVKKVAGGYKCVINK